MARVTVADLRREARRKLKECGGGKTISRMNRTELIHFLQCIDDRALADTYEEQEAERQYERAQTIPTGFFSERKPRRKKQRVDDQVTITKRRKKTSGSGHCVKGSGQSMDYRTFIKGAIPELRGKGMSNQDAMKAAAKLWKRYKMQGRGLTPTGSGLKPTGSGLEPAGDTDGAGTASDIAKYSDYTAKALGAASVIPGVGEFTAPVAAAAKGVSFISSLFE
jgi:hypothetical protein